MALLNLNMIVFNRTIIGITCAKCGGNLIEKQAAIGKTLWVFSFRRVKYSRFRCEKCNRNHHVLSKS